MTEAARELREAAQIMKRVAKDGFLASGDALEVTRATPSASSAPRRGGGQNVEVASAVINSTEQFLREDIGTKIVESPGYADTDYGKAVASGGVSGLESATRQGIRNSVFNNIGRRVLSTIPANPGDLTKTDSRGRFHDAAGRFLHSATGYVQNADGSTHLLGQNVSMDANGRFRNMETGQFVSAADAAVEVDNSSLADARRNYERSMAVRAVAMSGLEAWRTGQPVGRALASALPANVVKAAGGASLGWQGFKAVRDKAKAYDAEFNQMREVYGGDNWDAASEKWDRFKTNFSSRLIPDMFGFGSVGGLKEREAFDDSAMQYGFRGNEREEYTDQAINLRHMAVGADQIKQIFDVAINAGQSLTGFASALKLVNDTAREAGVNARRAREVFIKNYEASSEFMFSGERSKTLAAGQAVAQVNLGRRFENADLTGTFTNQNMDYLFAARTGQSIYDFRSQADGDPGVRIVQNEEWLKTQLGYVTSGKNGKRFPQVVADFMATLGTEYNPDVHGNSLGAWITSQGIPIEVVSQMVAQTGVEGMSMSDSVIYAGQLFVSGFMSPGAQAQATADAQLQANSPSTFGSTDEVAAMLNTQTQGSGILPGSLKSAYVSGISPLMDTTTEYGSGDIYTAGELAIKAGGNTPGEPTALVGVQRYPLVEKLIHNAVDYGITDKTKVAVKTKDGWKEVEMWQAVGDFPDQLQSGVARITSGANSEWNGRTLPEILGVVNIGSAVDPSLQINAGTSSQSYPGGTSISAPNGATDFAAGATAASGGASGGASSNTVQIVMDPKLQQILNAVLWGDPFSPAPRRRSGIGVAVPS